MPPRIPPDADKHMSDELNSARADLEAMVVARTAELAAANRLLQADIVAREAAETAQQASLSKLDEAQRIAQVGSWELDLVSGNLHWSDEIFRIFEIDRKTFGATYEAFLNAVHPEDRDQVTSAYGGSLAARKPYEIAHRLLMADGRIKWVNERCESTYDDQGKPLRSMGTVQDITERKRVEETLRDSEERFFKAFHASPLMVSIARASDGRFIDANRNYERDFGWQREELIGRTSLDVGLWPDDETRLTWVSVLVRDGRVVDWETSWRHRNGESRSVSISAETVDVNGERCILAFVMDITARKQAEESIQLYASAFQHSAEAILISDSGNRILAVNGAFTRLTGYSSDEARGRDPGFLATGQTARETYLEMWAGLKANGFWQGEIWDRRKDGTTYPKWLSLSVVRDSSGEFGATTGSVLGRAALRTRASQRRSASATPWSAIVSFAIR